MKNEVVLFECIDILIDTPSPRSALAEESIDVCTERRRNIFFVSFLVISSLDVRSTEKINTATSEILSYGKKLFFMNQEFLSFP